MAQKYARGTRAWGICGRGGHKLLLKDMVFDERYPNMRVDPDWFEGKHPQELLPKVEDPIALYRPAPEVVDGPTAPVATAAQILATVSLTWTPSETDITEIASYTISRNVDGGAFSALITCNVLRDFLGGIIGVQGCSTIPSIPHNDTSSGSVFDKTTNEDAPITYVDSTAALGHTYCYNVFSSPMGNNQSVAQGPPSAASNTVCVPVIFPTPTTPVLSLQLNYPNIVLNWTAATIGVGAAITNYQVWRSLNGGGFALLTTVGNVLTYTDIGSVVGDTNAYFVVGVPNFGNNSPNSNTVSQLIPNDPFYQDVVLLLHFEGTNGQTTTVDSSLVQNTVALNGNVNGSAALSTVQEKFGASSMVLPQTSSNAAFGAAAVSVITQGSPLDILSGTADFTIDGWFYLSTAALSTNMVIFDFGNDQSSFSGPGANSGIQLRAANGGPASGFLNLPAVMGWIGLNNAPGLTLSPNTWYHFAVVRAAGTGMLFLNGALQGQTAPNSWVNYVFPATPSLAAFGSSATFVGSYNPGFLDEIRVTKGLARWTSNFTPPTGPSIP